MADGLVSSSEIKPLTTVGEIGKVPPTDTGASEVELSGAGVLDTINKAGPVTEKNARVVLGKAAESQEGKLLPKDAQPKGEHLQNEKTEPLKGEEQPKEEQPKEEELKAKKEEEAREAEIKNLLREVGKLGLKKKDKQIVHIMAANGTGNTPLGIEYRHLALDALTSRLSSSLKGPDLESANVLRQRTEAILGDSLAAFKDPKTIEKTSLVAYMREQLPPGDVDSFLSKIKSGETPLTSETVLGAFTAIGEKVAKTPEKRVEYTLQTWERMGGNPDTYPQTFEESLRVITGQDPTQKDIGTFKHMFPKPEKKQIDKWQVIQYFFFGLTVISAINDAMKAQENQGR